MRRRETEILSTRKKRKKQTKIFLQTKNKQIFKIPYRSYNAHIEESFHFVYKSLIETYRKRLFDDDDDDDECSSIINEKRY
jgi:hypothetical protein